MKNVLRQRMIQEPIIYGAIRIKKKILFSKLKKYRIKIVFYTMLWHGDLL